MKTSANVIGFAVKVFKAEWQNLVLWAYLLSPLIIRLITNYHYSQIDLLAFYTMGISLLWLLAIRFSSVNQFKFHLILLPFYLAAAVDLFLVLNFNSRLTAAYLFIGMTNYREADDFLPTYWQPISFVLITFLICYGAGLIGLYRRDHYENKGIFALTLCALVLGYGAYFYKTVKVNSLGAHAVLDLVAKDQSTPVGYLSQAGLTAHIYGESKKLIKQRQASEVKLMTVPTKSAIETLVFVIGESSRPHNWSLYGYDKKTTPNLDKQTGIFKFNRMCTTAPYTAVAVPSMLSLEPISDWDSIASTKSLVGIYRAAGYKTYWLSVQEVDSFGGIIPQIAAEANHRQYFERSFDGALIPAYEKILSQGAGEKQAIFIHVKGSHFDYSRRYPDDFKLFTPSSNSAKEKITAEYDNTVLYTDWLLGTIIDRLKRTEKPSLLFYSSDHGENLLDDNRELLGHGMGNEYDLLVSAFIWASDNVRHQPSLNLMKLKDREHQKISISSLSHTLLGATGVLTDKYKSSYDLLSDDFVTSNCPHLLAGVYVPKFDFELLNSAR
jgi:glucan phosphoethanolaminetransferase (alkaline phosphatase superfamily)